MCVCVCMGGYVYSEFLKGNQQQQRAAHASFVNSLKSKGKYSYYTNHIRRCNHYDEFDLANMTIFIFNLCASLHLAFAFVGFAIFSIHNLLQQQLKTYRKVRCSSLCQGLHTHNTHSHRYTHTYTHTHTHTHTLCLSVCLASYISCHVPYTHADDQSVLPSQFGDQTKVHGCGKGWVAEVTRTESQSWLYTYATLERIFEGIIIETRNCFQLCVSVVCVCVFVFFFVLFGYFTIISAFFNLYTIHCIVTWKEFTVRCVILATVHACVCVCVCLCVCSWK